MVNQASQSSVFNKKKKKKKKTKSSEFFSSIKTAYVQDYKIFEAQGQEHSQNQNFNRQFVKNAGIDSYSDGAVSMIQTADVVLPRNIFLILKQRSL